MEYKAIRPARYHYCIECGHPLESGRPDRKFCSLRCKNEYHNHQARGPRSMHLRVHSVLSRNYDILEFLIGHGITEIPLADIKGLGFNTDYFTSRPAPDNPRLCCCYDISYQLTASRCQDIRRVQIFTEAPKKRNKDAEG